MNIEEVIFIKPKRPHITTYRARWKDGKLYDAPMQWWADKNGCTRARIHARFRAIRDGKRDYSIEQALGTVDIPQYNGMQDKASTKVDVVEMNKSNTNPMALFLRSKLV